MSLDPDFAPFPAQDTLVVNQERASDDPPEFASVHNFLMQDVKCLASMLIDIREQLEREMKLVLEFFVGGKGVA